MKNSKKKILALITLSTFVTFSMLAQAADEISAEKVASVERPNGSVIEFYQVNSGPVFVLETGKAQGALLEDEIDPAVMTALEVYKYVCPGCEVPEALVAESAATGIEELSAEELGAPQTANKQITDMGNDSTDAIDDSLCPWSWFSTIDQCATDGTYYDYEHSYITDGWYYGSGELHGTAACCYRGECVYSIYYWNGSAWVLILTQTVAEGYYAAYNITMGCDGNLFYLQATLDCTDSEGAGHLCGYGSDCE